MSQKFHVSFKVLISLLFVLILSIAIPVTWARYVDTHKSENNTIDASRFYFTVDLLGDTDSINTDTIPTKNYTLYGGIEQSVVFNIRNYFDAYRITDFDTRFTIETSVQNAGTYDTSGIKIYCLYDNREMNFTGAPVVSTPLNTLYTEGTELTINGSNATESAFYLVIEEGYSDGMEVTVTITSTAPYQKEMNLVFTLKKDSGVTYFVREDIMNENYIEVGILFDETVPSGKLVIDWSGHSTLLVGDSTSSYFTVNGATAETKREIKQGMSVSLKLFKRDLLTEYRFVSEKKSAIYSNGTETYTITIVGFTDFAIPHP